MAKKTKFPYNGSPYKLNENISRNQEERGGEGRGGEGRGGEGREREREEQRREEEVIECCDWSSLLIRKSFFNGGGGKEIKNKMKGKMWIERVIKSRK